MRKLARIVGIMWMAVCAILWIWTGFYEPFGRVDGPYQSNWGVLTLLSDSQFGLGMVFILLGGVGFLLWRWGKGRNISA